ncbi:MAG: response regulator, partial [Geminicoccaceae bacterium]
MSHRVLIIDDEVSLARNIKDYLEVDGFEAEVCWDGEAGLAAFDELPADVVVLDLTLPGMDGLVVLERLHERAPRTKVIIITAHGD